MESRTEQFLDANGVTRAEVATALGLDASTVSRKASGSRFWKHPEIVALLAFLSARIGRQVTFEEVFAPEPESFDCPAATVSAVPDSL